MFCFFAPETQYFYVHKTTNIFYAIYVKKKVFTNVVTLKKHGIALNLIDTGVLWISISTISLLLQFEIIEINIKFKKVELYDSRDDMVTTVTTPDHFMIVRIFRIIIFFSFLIDSFLKLFNIRFYTAAVKIILTRVGIPMKQWNDLNLSVLKQVFDQQDSLQSQTFSATFYRNASGRSIFDVPWIFVNPISQ